MFLGEVYSSGEYEVTRARGRTRACEAEHLAPTRERHHV
jgi:hypothetical protein